MPAFDYKCEKCGKVIEYNTSLHIPKEMRPPEDMKCTAVNSKTCKDGKVRKYKCGGDLKKLFGGSTAFDIIGYCYENEYGKKAFKKNMSPSEYSDVLMGNKNPY